MDKQKCNISGAELSALIDDKVDTIDELEKQVLYLKKKAQEAQSFAKQASSQKIGLFGTKKALKAQQQVSIKYGEITEAQQELNELLVRNQRKIALITKELSKLGTMSLAMNRATVKRLEDILLGKTPKELSSAAAEELKNVIRELKEQEDFMLRQQKAETTAKEASKAAREVGNAQRKTDQRVKAQDKRVARLERNQRNAFRALGISIILLVVVIFVALRPSPGKIANVDGQENEHNQSGTQLQGQSLTSPETSETEATSSEVITFEAAYETDSTNTESIIYPSETIAETIPSVTEEQIVATINMDSLVGASFVGVDAYFSITKENDTYWFSFVVANGAYPHLTEPVPLISMGDHAQAFYSEDSSGYSGNVKIRCGESGRKFITAVIDDDTVPQYDIAGSLSALILQDKEMIYDDKILEYPIYIDYLAQ